VTLLDRLRTTRLDAALAAGFTVIGLVQALAVPIARPGLGELFVIGSTLPLAWRRTFPVESSLASLAFWMIPLDGFPVLGFVVVILQFFALGHLGEPGRAVGSVTVVACAVAVVSTLLGPEAPVAAITGVLTVLAPVAAGRVLRREQRQKQALVDLNHELVAERTRSAQAAVDEERARIAQELHDVVGHEVTLIAIQAEAAAAALRIAPERAVQPVGAIRDTAHRTLTEIRAVLGVLAPGGESSRPGSEGLAALVERARQAGVDCRFSVSGTAPADESAIAMAVSRVARECLTNAARHAPGQPVQLDVRWSPDVVDLRSQNPVDARVATGAPGRGLTGMRHRAELLGGTFFAGVVEGCFEVRVTIPAERRW
jgi:signal transduction histidine kinase